MNKYRSVIIWLFILILSMSLSLSWDVGKLDDVLIKPYYSGSFT